MLCYPPFSQLAQVLTKMALEGPIVVLCTPEWGSKGEHAYWRSLLDRMTVGRTELAHGPIYVPVNQTKGSEAKVAVVWAAPELGKEDIAMDED